MDKSLRIPAARARIRNLVSRMSAEAAARRAACEFDVCIYAVRGSVFASYAVGDSGARYVTLY